MVTRCAHVAGVWWATWYIAGGLYAAPACVARTYTIAGDTGLPHVRVTQGLRVYGCVYGGVAVLYLLFGQFGLPETSRMNAFSFS